MHGVFSYLLYNQDRLKSSFINCLDLAHNEAFSSECCIYYKQKINQHKRTNEGQTSLVTQTLEKRVFVSRAAIYFHPGQTKLTNYGVTLLPGG